MSILNISYPVTGLADAVPSLLYINTNDLLATVLVAGYLDTAKALYGNIFSDKQMAIVYTSDFKSSILQVSVSADGVNASLQSAAASSPVALPTVANQIVYATDTVGALAGAGANIVNTGSFINTGAITATTSLTATAGVVTSGAVAGGFAGKLTAFSTTAAKGSISLLAANNTGDFDLDITNADILQNQVMTVPNVGSTGSFLTSSLVLSEPGANIIVKNITVGQAALATAGEVIIQASAGTDQYKILEVMVNSGGTDFSGGGGDRLGQVTDGTTVYSVVPAASMQTLVNSRWGDTATPFPASAAMNVSTAAAADVVFSYSGGATDYTAGSLVVTVTLEKVA